MSNVLNFDLNLSVSFFKNITIGLNTVSKGVSDATQIFSLWFWFDNLY